MDYQASLFFGLALLSGFVYAMQQVFLAQYVRKLDGPSVSVYRNLSFIVVMLPLLFFATPAEILQTLSYWPIFLLAGICGALGLFFGLESQKYLPIGIVMAFSQTMPLLLILWVFLFFGETLSMISFVFIGIIILGVLPLVLTKNTHMTHLNSNIFRGILFVSLGVFFGSLSFFTMSIAATHTHPLVTGYFWEVSIGLIALLFVSIRGLMGKTKLHRISLREFGSIALAASPTVIGSGALPMAMAIGPVGIAQSLCGSGAVLVSVLLSKVIHHEHLRLFQYIGIGIILLGVVGLRMVQG